MRIARLPNPNAEKLRQALDESVREREREAGASLAEADHEIEQHARQIDEAKVRGVELILEIGRYLSQVRELLGGTVRDGGFARWVRDRCGFSVRSAYDYSQANETFGHVKRETVTHFDATAIYLLSSETVPEEAAAEAITRASTGERTDTKRAKRLVEKFASDQDRPQQNGVVDRPLELLGMVRRGMCGFDGEELKQLAVGRRAILLDVDTATHGTGGER